MKRSYLSIPLIVLITMTSCGPIPKLGQAPMPRTPESLASGQSFSAVHSNWPREDWWTQFGDPALGQLIDEALANSPDVAIAAARIRSAEALAQQSKAALLPNLSAGGNVGGVKQSENFGIPPLFVPNGIQDTAAINGSLSFNLDLWGKNRAALAAATSEAEAARVDGAQARLMLATSIASSYANLAQNYALRDVAVDALRVRQATVDLTAQRVAVGVDTRGSLRQAEARVPAARADILALDEAILLSKHQIAALVGAGPDRGLTIARPKLSPVPVGIPEDTGIEIIARRPDIAAASLRALAAEKRIKVAHADFYPNINLTALVGLESLGLGNLFKGTSSYGNGGAAVTLPLFDGGRLAGQYRGARADYDVAVATYDKTLVSALQETADALTSRVAADARLSQQRQALVASEEARSIATARYRGGLSDQLSVLLTDDAVLANRQTVAQLEGRRLTLDITLIRSLGGGYRTPKFAKGQ